MPATPAQIAFVLEPFRSVVAGPDATVQAKYGDLARDTKDEPVETFFDDPADAQVIADERFALLKADRRRFRADIAGEATALGLSYSQTTPAAQLVDSERQANLSAAIVEIGIDFGAGRSILTVWG